MIGLIDIDILIFHYGTVLEHNFDGLQALPFEQTKLMLMQKIDYLVEDLGLTDWFWSLGDHAPGFRQSIMPQYKAHRKCPPENVLRLREWFAKEYSGNELPKNPTMVGLEADDILGYHQSDLSTIIISGDKDMLQIPGWNYHPFKLQLRKITRQAADSFLLYQALVGDSADGYPGCRGIGEKTALAILMNAWEVLGYNMEKLWAVVHMCYLTQGLSTDDFRKNAECARILRCDEMHQAINIRIDQSYKKILEEILNNGHTPDGLRNSNPSA